MRCVGIFWEKSANPVPNEALYQAEPQPAVLSLLTKICGFTRQVAASGING
jgi:hypothetical protein